MNADFFPLFIGTHDKTVLQLIQMLLSGILMGLKCNQNTHKKSRKCFQLPFWFPIYFYSWNEGGTLKNILDLIKNAPRCKRQKRTISTDCITDYDRKKKCMVHNWPFDLFDTTETNSFPHSIKTNMDSFLTIYRGIRDWRTTFEHTAFDESNIQAELENMLPQCESNINFRTFGNNRHCTVKID